MCGLGVPVGCRMKHAKGMFKRCGLGAALLPAQQVQHHTQVDHPRQAPQPLPKYGRPYGYRICLLSAVQQLAHLTGEAGAGAFACLVPARKAKDGPRRLHQVDDLNRYYGNAGTAALALKGKTFRRKTYLPKAYNFHIQMPGSLNWRMTHARRTFTRCGLTLES